MRLTIYIWLLLYIFGCLVSYGLGYKVGQRQVVLKSVENMEVKDGKDLVNDWRALIGGRM